MSATIDGTNGVTFPAGGTFNPSGTAPVYMCRAWVNFDGTKDTTGAASTSNTARLIRGSGNVTSVVRNATGSYTVNFTTAMADANYATTSCVRRSTGTGDATFHNIPQTGTYTASAVQVSCANGGGTAVDTDLFTVAIFG